MGSTWQKIRTKIEGTNQYNNIPKKPGKMNRVSLWDKL